MLAVDGFVAITFIGLVLMSAVALAGAYPPTAHVTDQAPPSGIEAGRRATLLAVNDIYRIGGIDRGERGGLARLRTLRRGSPFDRHSGHTRTARVEVGRSRSSRLAR